MPQADERIERLGKTIIQDAKESAEKIISDAQQQAEKIIKDAYEQYKRDETEQLEEERHKSCTLYAKEISSRDFAAQKSILAHRNELVNGLFETVAERLLEFGTTDSYGDFLLSLIKKADSQIKIGGGCIICISPKDRAYADELKAAFSTDVKTDKNIVFGGVLVYYPDKKIYIDYTLDTALEQQKKEFVNKKELAL